MYASTYLYSVIQNCIDPDKDFTGKFIYNGKIWRVIKNNYIFLFLVELPLRYICFGHSTHTQIHNRTYLYPIPQIILYQNKYDPGQ